MFTKSKEFLNLGEVTVVPSRRALRQELGARESGGFYICTIQKFCDREDDKIGLINSRSNIICFSDEAHRTQLEHAKKIQFSKDADENMRAMVSKPYAKVLKEAFPQATFVGFSGTPIAEKIRELLLDNELLGEYNYFIESKVDVQLEWNCDYRLYMIALDENENAGELVSMDIPALTRTGASPISEFK